MTNDDFSLKEIVSAALSIAIVGLTLWMMWSMFVEADATNGTNYQRHSAVLQVALGLAGAVTGYYFGRVPAEKAASASEQAAKAARGQAAQAADDKSNVVAKVEALKAQLAPGATPTGGGAATPDDVRVFVHGELDRILSSVR